MLNKHFRDFIELLEKRGVRYLVVGGYAVGLHGFPRYTGDLDIFVAMSLENGGLRIPFIGLDELLRNKAASPRGKDRIDLEELQKARTKKPGGADTVVSH